jgi:EAL domain-containing protein (putative c-di-GMP-specific phosphodiesterase class I)
MRWTLDFEFVSFVLSILILADFKTAKVLPMKSSKLFEHSIFVLITLELLELCISLLDNSMMWTFTGLQQFIHTLSFLLVFAFMFTLYLYLRCLSSEDTGKFYYMKPYDLILFFVAGGILILNLFTGIIFKNTASGYERGPLFYSIFYPMILAGLAFCAVPVINSRKYINKRVRGSIYLALLFIAVTSFFQTYIDNERHVLSLGFSVALVIIYLTYENTSQNVESKTYNYNGNGYRRYMNELILSQEDFKTFFIQIENYSSVLSIYGREKTDNLLRQLGKELASVKNTSFYLHNGLFIVIDTDNRDYNALEDKIKAILSRERFLGSDQVFLNYYTATTDNSSQFKTPQEMLSVAADTLRDPTYDKPPFEPITAGDVEKSARKSKLTKAIYHALDHNGVLVYYQPIYDNTCDRIRSAEALSRLYDSELGIIFPDDFIPVFEQDGTILKFGRIMFEKVCSFIHDNDMTALGLDYIEVNLSPIQCMRPSLPDELISIADSYGVDMKYLNFEITETAALSSDQLSDLMIPLINRGASFSVDDFGTGYSNLIRVTTMPFKIIKIDKSILWDYFKTRDDLVPSIYEIMNNHGFELVTEGVETEDMHIWLKDQARCKYEQGYYYSKPISEEEFIKYLKQHKDTAA